MAKRRNKIAKVLSGEQDFIEEDEETFIDEFGRRINKQSGHVHESDGDLAYRSNKGGDEE